MKENVIMNKSFALKIIEAYKHLCEMKHEYVLSKQLLRSGTAIEALVKEANEMEYWLMLLKESNYLDEKQYNSLIEDCREILRLLISIVKTTKKSLNK